MSNSTLKHSLVIQYDQQYSDHMLHPTNPTVKFPVHQGSL